MSSIPKNAALMTLASIVQKIISFVYFTIIARNIGVSDTGKYFFALSFTTIFVVFVDLGLTNVLVREAARTKEKIQEYLSTILAAKFVFGALSYLAAIIFINLMGYDQETSSLVYLSSVTMIFDSLHLTLYGILRAMGNLKYESYGIIGSQLLTFLLGSIFLQQGYPLLFLILAFTIPSFFNLCFVGTILYVKYSIKFIPIYDYFRLKQFVRLALPFGIAAILARFYSYADTIILSSLAGDTAVGWYSIAYKITFAFQFVPLALIAALYPRFSECYAENKEKLSRLFEQSVKYLLIVVLPVAVGIGVLARDIIVSIYKPDFLPSVLPLQILLVGLIFSYISFPIGSFLNACNRQTTQTLIVGLVLSINILLNVIFIPGFGVVAAAIAALVGNMLLTCAGYFFVSKIVSIDHIYLIKTFIQLFVSAIVMGFTVNYINFFSGYIIAIPFGIVVYLCMIFLIGAITKRELSYAVALITEH